MKVKKITWPKDDKFEDKWSKTQQEIRLFWRLPLEESSLASSLRKYWWVYYYFKNKLAINYVLVYSSRKTLTLRMLSQEKVDCNGIRQEMPEIWSFYILYFLGNTIIKEKNDEFNIKDERMVINRRQSLIKTALQHKYIVFLQATSIKVAARAASHNID